MAEKRKGFLIALSISLWRFFLQFWLNLFNHWSVLIWFFKNNWWSTASALTLNEGLWSHARLSCSHFGRGAHGSGKILYLFVPFLFLFQIFNQSVLVKLLQLLDSLNVLLLVFFGKEIKSSCLVTTGCCKVLVVRFCRSLTVLGFLDALLLSHLFEIWLLFLFQLCHSIVLFLTLFL